MLVDTIPQFQMVGSSGNFVQNENGILMAFDGIRMKWLSVSRNSIEYMIDHSHLKHSQWMMYNNIWSNLQGYDVNRNMTVTQISVQTIDNSNSTYKIISNNDIIYTAELINESKKIIDNLNIDVDLNTSIKILLEVNEGEVNYPSLKIEYAWR